MEYESKWENFNRKAYQYILDGANSDLDTLDIVISRQPGYHYTREIHDKHIKPHLVNPNRYPYYYRNLREMFFKILDKDIFINLIHLRGRYDDWSIKPLGMFYHREAII